MSSKDKSGRIPDGVTLSQGSVAEQPGLQWPDHEQGDMLPEELPLAVHPARYGLRVLKALRRIIRAVDLHSRQLAALHKITSPQLVCLLAIEEHEPLTVSAIAKDIHLSPSTLIGILDRLESKGLLRRNRDLKDRRLVNVSLTEPGRELIQRAPSPLQDTLADAMNSLPEPEQATITESLERIVELMEARHVDAAPILETGPLVSTQKEAEEEGPLTAGGGHRR